MESLRRLQLARRHGLVVLDSYDALCRNYLARGETRRDARRLAREMIERDDLGTGR